MKQQIWLGAAVSCGFAAAFGQALAQPAAVYQQTDYEGREIGPLTGDVYYARMDDYVSAFIVTPEGIALVEPIGTQFATWLKAELAQRFDQPVKYVIYSHSHADHASGAAVYADTAEIIAQENLLDLLAMPPADTPLPDNMTPLDANGDGRIARAEAEGRVADLFEAYDADDDDAVSGAEAVRGPLAFVAQPTRTFADRLDLELGGKRIELISMPTDHAPDNTVVRFVDGSNVVFASDWITNERVPFGPNVTLQSEIDKIEQVAELDFEHFVCSHGRLGTKADVQANLAYRQAVRDAVADAIADGKSLEETQESVLMDDYSDWEFYPQQRPLNVAGAYRLQTAGE